jgi:transcriptional regulator with XRE-family HTH domain
MNAYALRRYEARLSLIEAAHRSGVGRTTISRLENGRTERPSPSVAAKLARTYGVTIAELLDAGPSPASPESPKSQAA